jgi:hypothetical protein
MQWKATENITLFVGDFQISLLEAVMLNAVKHLVVWLRDNQPPVIPQSWGNLKKMGDTPKPPAERTLLHLFSNSPGPLFD